MKSIDFFVDFATTGHVEETGLGSSPEEWDRNVGLDYVDDVRKKQLRRDYGLLELTFWRTTEAWNCTDISVQVHRLWWDPANQGPTKLVKKYGAFPQAVSFEALREKLVPLDHTPIPIEDQKNSEYIRHRVPKTNVLIVTLSSPAPSDVDDIPNGMIWSMNLSVNAEIWTKPFK